MDFDTLSLGDMSLLLISFFDSRETRHRTIVAETEDDSTSLELDEARVCADGLSRCVQLERWWIIHHRLRREREKDAAEWICNVHQHE